MYFTLFLYDLVQMGVSGRRQNLKIEDQVRILFVFLA
jgi:hypothetical protein